MHGTMDISPLWQTAVGQQARPGVRWTDKVGHTTAWRTVHPLFLSAGPLCAWRAEQVDRDPVYTYVW